MNVIGFFKRVRMIFNKMTFPKVSEFWRTARITLISALLIGGLGLLVYFVFLVKDQIVKFLIG